MASRSLVDFWRAARARWQRLPMGLRRFLGSLVKAGLTLGAFYLLLAHEIDAEGQKVRIYVAIAAHLGELDPSVFWPFIIAGSLVKFVGIGCSMWRWQLLLTGQGIRFDFWHVVGAFLIGRFLGTFLPSTVGLDGYKLYDAARFSGSTVRPAAATAVEKVMGFAGIFLTFLVALPFGAAILGDAAPLVIAVTVPVACLAIGGLFMLLFRPSWAIALSRLAPAGRQKLRSVIERIGEAAAAYRGKGRLLAAVMLLSFALHFTTAAMYWFTARGVGAAGAGFWEVAFASSIQIFATVVSPLTIAGEGVREIVQAFLLAKRIGASESILSAALGFWAAEALTMFGAIFLWTRRADYRPRRMTLAFSPDPPAAAPAASSVAGPAPSLSP